MTKEQLPVHPPVLDLAQPVHPSFLSSLSSACQEWGFFYVTNLGIPDERFSAIFSLSKDVFSLPQEPKLKLSPASKIKSYTPFFIASPYGPDFYASARASSDKLGLKQELLSELCELLQENGTKMMAVAKKVIEVLLQALENEFEVKFSDPEFSQCHDYLRIINYALLEIAAEKEDEGLGMHTDMSCISIVYQDENGGLQMRSDDGNWLNVDPCKGSLVVNIGDLMQVWSNGRLRSAEHRVVLRRSVNRYSLAFFWCFEDEKVILAPDEVADEGMPGCTGLSYAVSI